MNAAEAARRLAGRTPGFLGAGRPAAVLVPLVDTADGASLLFEVRAAGLRRQPGEVCFPGGRMEPGETAEDCALRETREELGILEAQVAVAARLDALGHQTGTLVYPVLGQVAPEALETLACNPAEVAEAFSVPLDFFLGTAPEVYAYELTPRAPEDFPHAQIGFPEGYPWKGGRVEVPVYHWRGRAIWGLTGRIVRALAEELGR